MIIYKEYKNGNRYLLELDGSGQLFIRVDGENTADIELDEQTSQLVVQKLNQGASLFDLIKIHFNE